MRALTYVRVLAFHLDGQMHQRCHRHGHGYLLQGANLAQLHLDRHQHLDHQSRLDVVHQGVVRLGVERPDLLRRLGEVRHLDAELHPDVVRRCVGRLDHPGRLDLGLPLGVGRQGEVPGRGYCHLVVGAVRLALGLGRGCYHPDVGADAACRMATARSSLRLPQVQQLPLAR